MDSKDSTERTPGALNHPAQDEWMAFLYDETPPKTRRELQTHLEACAACAAQVQSWRSAVAALDTWKLPRRRALAFDFAPIAKWAVAAAVLMLIGFFLGRRGSPSASEIANLKASVAQLNQSVQSQSAANLSNSVAAATDQVTKLFAEHSRLQEERRAVDQQTVDRAMRAIQIRLNRLDSDLETVAANTESGFEQTHENIARVVSLSLASTKANATPQ